jgi:hypothetical protein
MMQLIIAEPKGAGNADGDQPPASPPGAGVEAREEMEALSGHRRASRRPKPPAIISMKTAAIHAMQSQPPSGPRSRSSATTANAKPASCRRLVGRQRPARCSEPQLATIDFVGLSPEWT